MHSDWEEKAKEGQIKVQGGLGIGGTEGALGDQNGIGGLSGFGLKELKGWPKNIHVCQ